MDNQFLKAQKIMVEVLPTHPLIKLMNALDWEELGQIILPDLKKSTSKLKWWLGRKLKVRTHLGVFLLQQLLNETDRWIERQLRDNAVYAVFCGKAFVHNWKVPDHTKIEEFRSRLSPQTQCALANALVKLAAKKGFAQPAHIDIDSSVQTPDMQYPATVNLLVKAAIVGWRVQKILMQFMPEMMKQVPEIDMKAIKGIAKQHYFEKSKAIKQKIEARKQALAKLWGVVSEAIQPVICFARIMDEPFIIESLPVRDKNMIVNFIQKAPALLGELFERCYENLPRQSKIFSFHRNEVDCFNKNKHHKGIEFGRQFQIGRVGGNFVYSIPNDSIRMPDAASLKKMVVQHIELFQMPIESIGTDKGYYSKDNEKLALDFGVKVVGIQKPQRKFKDAPINPISQEQLELLENRRAGIEPIIGHLKKYWQMGRSRMKSDQTTEASGYCALLGFNLRQMIRYLTGQAVAITPG
jgi:transposase, IS5 family